MTEQEYYNRKVVNTRLVETGLVGRDAYEILESVIGQLSDGIGENKYHHEKYWRFADVLLNPQTDKVEIRISNTQCEKSWMYPKRWLFNPFLKLKDKEIKQWFGRKVRWIARIEAKDKGRDFVFSTNNHEKMEYLGDWNQTVAEAVEVYNSLMK